MSEKNCMFQLATPTNVIKDTGLMTLKEAKALWKEHEREFVELHAEGKEPEMCIWIDCENDSDYRKTLWHVDYSSVINDGQIYNLQLQGKD